MRRIKRKNTGNMAPGQDLVVVGYAGLAGSLCLADARREELSYWFSRDYLKEVCRLKDWLVEQDGTFWESIGATEWEQCGLGGIFNTLWVLSGAYGVGLEFILRKIPILQETIEICERLECNPYRLYSNGCWILAAFNGGQLVTQLEKRGISSKVIGKIHLGIAREIVTEDGHSFLERPREDEIFKILPNFQIQAP